MAELCRDVRWTRTNDCWHHIQTHRGLSSQKWLKDVRIGFEPPSWDVAGWVENLGKGGVLWTFVIDFYPLYLLGALLAHTACSPRLRQAHSRCRRPHTHAHTNTQPHFPFYYHHTPGRGRIDALGQFSKCGSVQMRHIKWLVINLARQLQTPQLLSVINSIGAWGLVLLLVWASRALLTRAHYSRDYSPDKGTFSGTYFCAIFVGRDLQVVFRKPDVWNKHKSQMNGWDGLLQF